MSATSLDVISATHEEWASEQIANSFFDVSDTTMMLYKSNSKYQASGGTSIVWSAEIAQATTAAGVAAGATVAATSTEFARRASLDWKFVATLTNRDKEDFDIYNAGPAGVINLYRGWLENIKKCFRETVGDMAWSNTVGANDYTSLATAIDGTTAAFPAYVPAAYANINPAVNARWSSYRADTTNTSVTIADCVAAINDIRFRRGGKADMIVCGFDDYAALEAEGLGAVRHPNVSAGATTELGIPTFTIHGAKVVIDRFLDAEPANGGAPANSPLATAGANKVYILSTDEMGFIPQPKEKMVGYKTIDKMIQMSNLVDLFPITGARKYQLAAECGGQIIVPNRRVHGVILHV